MLLHAHSFLANTLHVMFVMSGDRQCFFHSDLHLCELVKPVWLGIYSGCASWQDTFLSFASEVILTNNACVMVRQKSKQRNSNECSEGHFYTCVWFNSKVSFVCT